MSDNEFREWFQSYLAVFAGGDANSRSFESLLDYYAVPLVVTTPEGVLTLTSRQQVGATIRHQLDGLRGQDYASTALLRFDVREFNAHSASLSTVLQRSRADGTPLETLAMTYLVTGSPTQRTISMMAVEG